MGVSIWGVTVVEMALCPKSADNVILTETERLTMEGRPAAGPKYARNKNILVVGGSGSGKTRFFVKRNLLQMHSSYVITDPKMLVYTLPLPAKNYRILREASGLELLSCTTYSKTNIILRLPCCQGRRYLI